MRVEVLPHRLKRSVAEVGAIVSYYCPWCTKSRKDILFQKLDNLVVIGPASYDFNPF